MEHPCTQAIPPIALTKDQLGALRPDLKKSLFGPDFDQDGSIEQNPISCIDEGAWIYFGIHFYESEGVVGSGGIGRFNPSTKSVEIRRPKALRPFSVRKMVKREGALWLATEDFNEGTAGPALGLARFDWDKDHLQTFRGKAEGPCGFWVNDLLLTQDELWVATELGISRYHFANGQWKHFVPVARYSQELREATCREIYVSVAASLPDDFDDKEDGACDLDGTTPRAILRSLIKQCRPDDLNGVPLARPVDQ
jgi:hypothetical protein